MPPDDEPQDPSADDLARTREAARIFRRLEEHPSDPRALEARVRFLARGEAERLIYARMERALSTVQTGMTRRRVARQLGGLGVVLIAAWLAFAPLRAHFLADHAAGWTPERVALLSGDQVDLDAGSALVDRTEGGGPREVVLLEGAALFDVAQGPRGFSVEAGALTVEVIGTTFEVTRSGSTLSVAVAEGVVDVRADERSWRLEAGDRLSLTDGVARQGRASPGLIAPWRRDRLIIDGMNVAEVVEILDRRLRGEIILWNSDLGDIQVAGTLDLSRPEDALRTLASASGAEVTIAPYLGAVLHR